MPRGPRIVLPGIAHHVTQRGIRQSQVFLDDADRLFYSELLLEASHRHSMFIHSYNWMTNHVHIIAVPEYPDTAFLKTTVHQRPVGLRPLVEFEPTDHPLAVHQREGIDPVQLQEMVTRLLHRLPAKS